MIKAILLATFTLTVLFFLVQTLFSWQIATAFVSGCISTDLFWGLALRKQLLARKCPFENL